MRKLHLPTLSLTFALCVATSLVTSAQTVKTLVDFSGNKGVYPSFMTLVQGRDGFLYGTTYTGYVLSPGTVFKAAPAGLTTIYKFCFQNCQQGSYPGQLLLATDGNLYGETAQGGAASAGTIFKITPSGTLTTLHTFNQRADGITPEGGLIQANDGNFYGVTESGGAYGYGGLVFKMTPQGAYSVLYSFCDCGDGSGPSAVIQAADGNFYGTTRGGGANGYGTVFKLTPQGVLATLHSFDSTDGAYPGSRLLQASDGNLYGTTAHGGNPSCTDGCGTVFEITPDGTFTSLHTFDTTDGANPSGVLIQGTDGNLYGTAGDGGSANSGTIYQIPLGGGNLTTIYNFCSQANCTDGAYPSGGLMQYTNGTFYGTTTNGGNPNCGGFGCGTLFSLNMHLGPFVSFVNPQASVGQNVEILGQGLTGTTAVSFNGTPTSFKAMSATYLVAAVPAGATSGPVTVTTPSGTLTSNKSFVVVP